MASRDKDAAKTRIGTPQKSAASGALSSRRPAAAASSASSASASAAAQPSSSQPLSLVQQQNSTGDINAQLQPSLTHALLRHLHARDLSLLHSHHALSRQVHAVSSLSLSLRAALSLLAAQQTQLQTVEYGLYVEREHARKLAAGTWRSRKGTMRSEAGDEQQEEHEEGADHVGEAPASFSTSARFSSSTTSPLRRKLSYHSATLPLPGGAGGVNLSHMDGEDEHAEGEEGETAADAHMWAAYMQLIGGPHAHNDGLGYEGEDGEEGSESGPSADSSMPGSASGTLSSSTRLPRSLPSPASVMGAHAKQRSLGSHHAAHASRTGGSTRALPADANQNLSQTLPAPSSSGSSSANQNQSFTYHYASPIKAAKAAKAAAAAAAATQSPSSNGGVMHDMKDRGMSVKDRSNAPSLNLTANTFLPPSAEEIEREIALTKSPPADSDQARRRSASGASSSSSSSSDATSTATETGKDASMSFSYSSNDPTHATSPLHSKPNPDITTTAINMNDALQREKLKEIEKAQQASTTPASASSSSTSTTTSSITKVSSSNGGLVLGLASLTDQSKQWRPKLALRGHMDAVRCVAFDRNANETDPTLLLSAGEDGVAQLWNITAALRSGGGLAGAARKSAAAQPPACYTYRGHRGMITSVALRGAQYGAFTAGIDGEVMQWRLPSDDILCAQNPDLYPCTTSLMAMRTTSVKHDDAVWSMDLYIPTESDTTSLLATAVANGDVCVWKASPLSSPADDATTTPLHSIRMPDPADSSNTLIPSSVQFMPTSSGRQALAGYTNGLLALIDLETGKVVSTLKGDADPSLNESGFSRGRLTQLAAHPEAELAMSAHADSSIRFWDVKSSTQVAIMSAHRGVVSCLALDGTGLHIASGSHDASIRIWNAAERKIRQVLDTHQTHRSKYQEAIHSVTYHQTQPFLASAGADGIIKLYV